METFGRTAVIGCGNLGGVLVRGLARKLYTDPSQVIVFDQHQDKVRLLVQQLGVSTAKTLSEIARNAGTIIIAVKPKDVPVVLGTLREALEKESNEPLLVSVAAGITLASMAQQLGSKIRRVARAMPNIAVLVSEGMTAVYATAERDRAFLEKVFSTVGRTITVEYEEDLDAVTGLSATGPAFFFTVIEGMIAGGVKMGLSRERALLLATQTMRGSAALLQETGKHPAELRDLVTSPAGTTIAGLQVLEDRGLRGTLIEAVGASVERARELANRSKE